MSEPITFTGPSNYSLGNIRQGEIRTIEITLTNNGEANTLLTPWSTCGCTTPTVNPSVIAPGGNSTLTVVYNTAGKSGLQAQQFGFNYKTGDTAYGVTFRLTAKVIK